MQCLQRGLSRHCLPRGMPRPHCLHWGMQCLRDGAQVRPPTNQPTRNHHRCCGFSCILFVVAAAASRRKFFLVVRGQASAFQQVVWHWCSPCHIVFHRTWAMEPATSSALRMGARSMAETAAPAHQSACCGKVMASAMPSVMTTVPVRSRIARTAPMAAHLSK